MVGPYDTLSAARKENLWEEYESPVFVLYMALGNGKGSDTSPVVNGRGAAPRTSPMTPI